MPASEFRRINNMLSRFVHGIAGKLSSYRSVIPISASVRRCLSGCHSFCQYSLPVYVAVCLSDSVPVCVPCVQSTVRVKMIKHLHQSVFSGAADDVAPTCGLLVSYMHFSAYSSSVWMTYVVTAAGTSSVNSATRGTLVVPVWRKEEGFARHFLLLNNVVKQ